MAECWAAAAAATKGMGKGQGITHTSLTPRGRTPPPKARSITGHPKERRRPSTPSNNSSAVLHVAPPFTAAERIGRIGSANVKTN